VFPVAPLPLATEAVALFAQRARAANLRFVPTEANAPSVAAIVRRVEGLPLAIELAAARVRHLSPAELLAQMADPLRVLTGGPRDAPARQRALRDTIAWSYGLLVPAEQTLFRRLAVFAGGCTPDAAAAVCEADGGDVLDGLLALVDQSLLRRVAPLDGADADDAAPRFGMLETVREFAAERLEAAGEAEAVRARHAAYMAEFAQRTARVFESVSVDVLARLAAEQDNARAALTWATGRSQAELGLRIATAYYRLWKIRGHLSEGRRWLGQLLALNAGPPALVAAALFQYGWLALLQGDLAAAEAACREAQALAQTIDSSLTLSLAVTGLGIVALDRGDLGEAEARCTEALALARITGDDASIGGCLLNLGVVAAERGDAAGAAAYSEQALPFLRRSGDPWALALLLGNLGQAARREGDFARAAALDRERLAINRDLRNREQVGDCCLVAVAVAVRIGQTERSARLLGAGTALLEEIAFHPPADWQRRIDAATEAARAALGDEAFAAVRDAGRALTLEEAVAEVDATFAEEETAIEPVPAPATPAPGAPDHGLSPRELEVVRLIAAGRSNQEIADALYISHGTATTHVRNILTKLALDSRTAVAAWAIRQGLD
ncbi:MAG: LuxR C-terminal-related transcriptional regulator, partial [Chloroflexota bacterium]|nr:LuxR C-terminal-related transcriptional regulator [Chloroflexota bacterium]